MEITYRIRIAEGQQLPEGYALAAHTTWDPMAGYYVLGAPGTCVAIIDPTLDATGESDIRHRIADAYDAAEAEANLTAEVMGR